MEIENRYQWLSALTMLHFILASRRQAGIMSYVKVHLCYGSLLFQVMRMYSNGGGYGWGIGTMEIRIIFLYGINSLVPGRCGNDFKSVISRHMLLIESMKIACEIAPRWMTQITCEDKSILVQVMAWCCEAPSHYLSQCWPRSISPYCINRS